MTESYRRPPAQKALPLTDWPQADRKAWIAAQERADVLDDGGMVSHLSPCTLEDLTRRYAYFLDFLTEEAKLNPHGPAAASVTEENIMLYVRYLEPLVSPVTLAQSLYKVSRVAACLAPKQDWRWLKRVARRLDLRAKPRDKRHEVVEIKALFELGVKLMNEAEKADNLAPLRRALLYRDGLIIALRAADPLRRANIAALEIGKTLVKDGKTWSLEIPAEETKERRLHLALLPDWCTSCIDRYVHRYRPLFPNAETTSRLWLGRSGRPLGESGLYHLVCRRTRAAFGKRINLHLFRSCLITSTAVHHGAQMGVGHDRPSSSELESHRAPLQPSQNDRRRARLSGDAAG
jgi:hypothetical protein